MLASIYDKPSFEKAYPFHQLIKDQLEDYGIRPQTPAYADVTLAIQDALSPTSSIDPNAIVSTLRSEIKTVPDQERCCEQRNRRRTGTRRPAPGASGPHLTRPRQVERRLAFWLVAPGGRS